MKVYIEELITVKSFLSIEIGNKLDLSLYAIEEYYNPIGEGGFSYYFFNKEINAEVYEKDGLIDSFVILLRNQENELYLGHNRKNILLLNNCNISDLILYLNRNNLNWKFEKILLDKSISISYLSKLKMLFYFDCE
jgi:hypothetical protein